MRAVEFVPRENFDKDVKVLEEFLSFVEVDFILIPDHPLGRLGVSAVVAAKMFQDALQIPSVATISGMGKSSENVRSLLLGARYAQLLGVACVSGDALDTPKHRGSGVYPHTDSLTLLELAQDLDFELKICTANNLVSKVQQGANLAISQPLFSPHHVSLPIHSSISILPSFMPLFNQESLKQVICRSGVLGFEVAETYRKAGDLMEANFEILQSLEDFYLIPLNLERQMADFKTLFWRLK